MAVAEEFGGKSRQNMALIPQTNGNMVISGGISAMTTHGAGREFLGVVNPKEQFQPPLTATDIDSVSVMTSISKDDSKDSIFETFMRSQSGDGSLIHPPGAMGYPPHPAAKMIPINTAMNMFRIGGTGTRSKSTPQGSPSPTKKKRSTPNKGTKAQLPPLSSYGLSVASSTPPSAGNGGPLRL